MACKVTNTLVLNKTHRIPRLDRRHARTMEVLSSGDIIDTALLPSLARNNLYKTELCKHFMESGFCRYGKKCQFAHGNHEMRGVLRHPKYKTTLCKVFATTGKCPYEHRCRFIHENSRERSNQPPSSPETILSSLSTTLAPLSKPTTKIVLAPVLLHRSSSGIDYSAFQSKTIDDYRASSSCPSSPSDRLNLNLFRDSPDDPSSLTDDSNLDLDLDLDEASTTTNARESCIQPSGRRLSFFQRIWNKELHSNIYAHTRDVI